MASVVAALGSTQQPVAIDRARIDRQIRELALEHAGGLLTDDTYLMRLKALRDQRDAIVERTAPGLPGHRAVEWLRALGESFQVAAVPKEKEELMHAIYERITVAGPEIVGVRLTQAAYAHGLALALPEKVEMARPTGVKRADAINIRIPIEGQISASWPRAPDPDSVARNQPREPPNRDAGSYFVSTYNVFGASTTTPNGVPATLIYPCSGEVRPHTSPLISRSYP